MLKKVLLSLLIAVTPFVAAAVENGTRDEAVAMVNRAVEVFNKNGVDGLVAAISDKDAGEFHDRDLYVFVYDLDGTVVGHGVKPQLVGKNLIGLKDQNGTALIQEMVNIARSSGEGWVDYIWPNPQTDALEPKSAWVVRIGDNHFLGVGVYGG